MDLRVVLYTNLICLKRNTKMSSIRWPISKTMAKATGSIWMCVGISVSSKHTKHFLLFMRNIITVPHGQIFKTQCLCRGVAPYITTIFIV